MAWLFPVWVPVVCCRANDGLPLGGAPAALFRLRRCAKISAVPAGQRAQTERGCGRVKKNCLLFLLPAVLLLLLCGCSGKIGNVEELLEAPKLSQSQSHVVEELNRYIGGSAKLKYPRKGDFLSPFVFKDLNGDGVEEAVVFYGDDNSEAKTKNVRIALLGQVGNKWSVLWDEEGLGTEVESVNFSSMYGEGAPTLIVGYTSTNLSDKFMGVYTYLKEKNTMQKVDERSYSEYALADFTGTGIDDLIVLSPATQPGPMQASLLSVQSGQLQPIATLSMDSLLQSCFGIYTSQSGGRYSLVVDGYTSGGTLASEELYFDAKAQRLLTHSTRLGVSIPNLSTRAVTNLRSRDIDEDGAVEIPVVLGNVSAFSTEQRMLWLSYYDFASIDTFENNFEKEAVLPGQRIQSVLPVLPQSSSAGSGLGSSSAVTGGSSVVTGSSSAATGSSAAHSGASSAAQPTPAPTPTAPPQQEKPTNEKAFGLADLSYGYYMQLPISWKNRVTVERMGTRNWYLTDTASGETLLVVQILGPDEILSGGVRLGTAEEYTQVAAVGRYRIFVRIREDTGIDTADILGKVAVLS